MVRDKKEEQEQNIENDLPSADREREKRKMFTSNVNTERLYILIFIMMAVSINFLYIIVNGTIMSPF